MPDPLLTQHDACVNAKAFSRLLPQQHPFPAHTADGDMAPIRRYLRVTKSSALEVRVYLEKPSDTAWLLSSRDPALPRIIKLIQPKVLPKLREENENSKKKGSKKRKNIKDVASQDDFEVALFLTDAPSRHSLITKHKQFTDKPLITSTSKRMTGAIIESGAETVDLSRDDDVPGLREEEADGSLALNAIPTAEDDVLSVSSDDDQAFQTQRPPASRRRRVPTFATDQQYNDDKKKMAVRTSYDSFSIYGKILCLIVKRKGPKSKAVVTSNNMGSGSGQMMEAWISTQADLEADLDD